MLVASYVSHDSVLVSQWMFADSVDIYRSPEIYGYNKCGPVNGIVVDGEGQPVDFASFDQTSGLLTLHPSPETTPGTYFLTVHFYMENYDFRFVDEPFVAEVVVCSTTLYSNGAFLDSRQTGWGDAYIEVDAGAALSMFTQSPDCGYPLQVVPKIDNGDGTFSDLPV